MNFQSQVFLLAMGFVVLACHLCCYMADNSTLVCPECCACEQNGLEIQLDCSCLPSVIPDNTTHFTVKEQVLSQTWINFAHSSWRNVKSLNLRLHADRYDSLITDKSFSGVPALEELHLTNYAHLSTVPIGTINSLHRLKILDVSNNINLSLPEFLCVLGDIQNLTLDVLNVSRTNRYYVGFEPTSINPNLLRRIFKLRVKILDMSWAGTLVVDNQFVQYNDFTSSDCPFCAYIEVLNSSHTEVITLGPLDLKPKLRGHRFDLLLPSLKHFIKNGFTWPLPANVVMKKCNQNRPPNFMPELNCKITIHNYFVLPPFLESVNADNFKIFQGKCMDQTLFLGNDLCIDANNSLKEFSIKNSGITGVNFLVVILNHLSTLDFRNNSIEIIADDSLHYFPALKRLLLGSNRMGPFLSNSTANGLLRYLKNLQEIDLSANDLMTIPQQLFVYNKRLEIINLSHNKLTTLTFELRHLSHLKLLDLSFNTISTIGEQQFESLRILTHVNNFTNINLYKNEFSCSCQSITFVENLHALSNSLSAFQSYVCTYKGTSVKLSSVSKTDLNDDCILELLTIALPVSSAVILIAMVSIIIYRNWIYVIKLYVAFRFWRYRNRLTDAEDRVFLSYSHHDKDLVLRHIYPELNIKLQRCIQTDKDVLYINDKDFALPGVIDEEIVKAVSSCKCTVALVSRRFLKSGWTHLEVSYSWARKRPIILVFLENIKENELHGILRYLYDKNVRLVWNEDSAQADRVIFWTTLLRGLTKILDCSNEAEIQER